MANINKAINSLLDICTACANFGTEKCLRDKCNIGYSLILLENLKIHNRMFLDEEISLIPSEDTKYYDEKKLAVSIASICKLCRECNAMHRESCAISLARKSVEAVILKDVEDYPGNVFSYLINVSRQNADFSNLVMEEYRKQ